MTQPESVTISIDITRPSRLRLWLVLLLVRVLAWLAGAQYQEDGQ